MSTFEVGLLKDSGVAWVAGPALEGLGIRKWFFFVSIGFGV